MRKTLKLCGREAELDTLSKKWRLASNILDPKPQVVVIKAERGVGKTRLGLEFFQKLSRTSHSSGRGYWPDDLEHIDDTTVVNPEPSDCNYSAEMPFLWWGIRPVERSAVVQARGDSLAEVDRMLAPHLAKLSAKSAVIQGVKDVGVALAKAGASMTPYELFNQLASAGMTIIETGQAVFGASKSASQKEAVKKPVSRALSILDELEKLFSPNRVTYAKTPGVIFIDDAQFAHSDAALPSFLEILLHRAITQNWPIMIFVTHWRAEMSPEKMPAENSFFGIIHHSRHGTANGHGPAASLPGGFLHDDHYTEIDLQKIDLAEHAGDLANAVAARLSGLTANQSKALLERTDGNPRYLEQVIKYAETKKSFFEGKSLEKPLTDAGLAALLDASASREIFDIVKLRLMEAPVGIQEAVCLASLQGMRFASELVDAIATAKLGGPRRRDMAEAENPYSFVSGASRASDQAIGQFVEGLFLQVAEDLRPDLETLPDEDQLQLSFREVLVGLLMDDAALDQMDPDPRVLACQLTVDQFEFSDNPEERSVAQRAASLWGYTEYNRLSLEAAAAAYERGLAIEPVGTEFLQRIQVLELLFEMYILLGWPVRAANVIKRAILAAAHYVDDDRQIIHTNLSHDAVQANFHAWKEKHPTGPEHVYLGCCEIISRGLLKMSELVRRWSFIVPQKGDEQADEWMFLYKLHVSDPEVAELVEKAKKLAPPGAIDSDSIKFLARNFGAVLKPNHVARTELDLLKELASNANRRNEPEMAKDYLERGLEIAESFAGDVELSGIIADLGITAAQTGDELGAVRFFDKADGILTNLLSGETFAVNIVADGEDGSDDVLRKLDIPSRFSDEFDKDPDAVVAMFQTIVRTRGNIFGNRAAFHWRDGRHDLAKRMYDKALELHGEINDPVGIAADLRGLGALAREREDHVEAKSKLEHALKIYRFLHDDTKNEFGHSRWSSLVEEVRAEIAHLGK
ncbi:MAG: tetratricopeptide repeat protein [Rubripirellula sp.]